MGDNLKKIFLALLATGVLVFDGVGMVQATPITISSVRTETGHNGFAVDSVTGKYYQQVGFGSDSGATLLVYDTATHFHNNVSSSTITLDSPLYGTYFTVKNNYLYGRTTNSTTEIARWDLSTGTTQNAVSSVADMGGLNVLHTFQWGGYSGVNFFQDNTGMYLFGKNLSDNSWQLSQIDNDLNITDTKRVDLGLLGYAFMLNGTLFLGEHFTGNTITYSFNYETGSLSSVDFTLEDENGNSGLSYWGNTFYDTLEDTLYFNSVLGDYNNNMTGLYSLDHAAVAFDVSSGSDPVPLPATILLFGTGLAGLVGKRMTKRKKK